MQIERLRRVSAATRRGQSERAVAAINVPVYGAADADADVDGGASSDIKSGRRGRAFESLQVRVHEECGRAQRCWRARLSGARAVWLGRQGMEGLLEWLRHVPSAPAHARRGRRPRA